MNEYDVLVELFSNGHMDAAKCLLRKGLRTDALDKERNTALHWAAEKNKPDAAILLLDYFAEPNAKNAAGRTPVHVAAWCSHSEPLKFLLGRGGAPNLLDNAGLSADQIARQMAKPQNPKVVEVLDHYAWLAKQDEMIEAAAENNTDAIERLLAEGVNPNFDDGLGRTPLHYAAKSGHSKATTLLIDADAKIEAKESGEGATPLHAAATAGKTDTAKILVERGADLNAVIDGKWTPLHGATAYKHVATVKALLELGANPEAKTDSGDTPLKFAEGNDEILALFAEAREPQKPKPTEG